MYYFAYGSNMDYNHLLKYIPKHSIKIIGGAYVNNFIFKYRKIETSRLRSGVANIEKRANSKTFGVVYYIDDNVSITNLDKKEGYYDECNKNNKYNKIIIQCVLLKNKKRVNCFTYQINNDYLSDEMKPRIQYLAYLKNGNRMHNLPYKHLLRINYIFT